MRFSMGTVIGLAVMAASTCMVVASPLSTFGGVAVRNVEIARDAGAAATNSFPKSWAISNESDVFATQYITSLRNPSDVLESCYAYYEDYVQRFMASGLNYMEIADVWCKAAGSGKVLETDSILPAVMKYTTATFTRRLIRGAGDGKFMARLCDYMDVNLLNQMGISNDPVETICRLAGTDMHAGHEGATLNNALSVILKNQRSELFGLFVLITFKTKAGVVGYCNNLKRDNVIAVFDRINLDVNVISDTVCSDVDSQPTPVSELVPKAQNAMSRIFVSQILGASQGNEFSQFLCNNMEFEGLAHTSLVPSVVRNQICGTRGA